MVYYIDRFKILNQVYTFEIIITGPQKALLYFLACCLMSILQKCFKILLLSIQNEFNQVWYCWYTRGLMFIYFISKYHFLNNNFISLLCQCSFCSCRVIILPTDFSLLYILLKLSLWRTCSSFHQRNSDVFMIM